MSEIEVLNGIVLTKVEQIGNDEIRFHADDGRVWRMFHDQSCCESVSIDDIIGDLNDLVGAPISSAREATSQDGPKQEEGYGPPDSFTWTFYLLRTIKGDVTIRWYGTSNGYYSESVSFSLME